MVPWHASYPSEYRTAKGWRIFIYLTMPLLAALFLWLPFELMQGKNSSTALVLGSSIVCMGLVGGMLYGLMETAKWKLNIGQWQITETGTFKTKTLALDAIRGYRTDDKYTRIYPRQQDQPVIKIGYTTERYQEIRLWLAGHYPNLDAVETEQATQELLADVAIGATPEARAAAVHRATRVARVLNIGGFAVAAWLFFWPRPHGGAIAAGLLQPLLAIAALWAFPHTLRIDEKKNSGHPSLLAGFIMVSLILLVRGLFDYEVVDYAPLWPVAGLAAVAVAGALALGSRKFLALPTERLSVGMTLLVLAALYGYSATVLVNGAYDEAPAQEFAPRVTGMHSNSGKTTTYYLTLEAWGPVPGGEDATVSHNYYRQVRVGQTVRVGLHPGRLGVPWYKVIEQ